VLDERLLGSCWWLKALDLELEPLRKAQWLLQQEQQCVVLVVVHGRVSSP
jgi:hypothetical protein